VKSLVLNFGLAKKFNTTCILRFDDTNPLTESTEYTDAIIRDIEWLGFTPSKITYASDYFKRIEEVALKMIGAGKAYVDESSPEEIANTKGTPTTPGTGTPARNRSIGENMKLFKEMISGKHLEGSMVLRARIDMASHNMLLRDPVLYRIIEHPHHRTGTSFSAYPTYDMAHPLCDYFEDITDSLCTLEFEVHRPLYDWVLDFVSTGGPRPIQTEFSRLNIEGAITSKRLIKEMIGTGVVTGWDDPSLFTVAGLRKRGFTPTSLRKFCERVGVTKRGSVISPELLEDILCEELNRECVRLMGVSDPVRLSIENWSGPNMTEVENNPENPGSGMRFIPVSGEFFVERDDFRNTDDKKFFRLKPDGIVRLKGVGVVRVTGFTEDSTGRVIDIRVVMTDEKPKGTIHWVDARDHMKVNSDEGVMYIEPVGYSVLRDGITVQFLRKGYYHMTDDILIKTLSLKSGYKG
jgi:glutaminyl-tRNA synthetase